LQKTEVINMRNIKAIKAIKGKPSGAAQKGFTIIELVVVILLLGILTATALPRFIDVTDEAKTAVQTATQGGLRTGFALYKAAVIAGDVASGSAPTATSDYTLAANDYGYPALSNGCQNIYYGLLQSGATTASSTGSTGTTCTFILTEVSRTLSFDVASGTVTN
jgi:prepilin-type N-terminal cleavage/methylation domain-containing protein